MSADIQLKWEWPADRKVDSRLLVKVTDIHKEGSGFFGIKKSPSLASSFPDPISLSGVVNTQDSNLAGKSIEIVVPNLEISDIEEGGYVVLGVVEDGVCVCIVEIDSPDVKLDTVKCP
ncbi:hypothetical protein ACFL2V_11785 [Pseudomonadota bacterium]